jgi:dihydrofolate synthase/folylpolyglutamate synthase
VLQHEFSHSKLALGLVGRHQRLNAALAVAAIEVFNQRLLSCKPNFSSVAMECEAGIAAVNPQEPITGDHIRKGLAEARLSGRTEIVCRQPTVLLDIAHNVASVAALVETLEELPEWNVSVQKTLIVSISNEKDLAGMLAALLPVFDRVIFTKYQNNPRANSAEDLLELARTIVAATGRSPALLLAPNPTAAWRTAIDGALASDFICCAGSAFLVAEMRPLVLVSALVCRN